MSDRTNTIRLEILERCSSKPIEVPPHCRKGHARSALQTALGKVGPDHVIVDKVFDALWHEGQLIVKDGHLTTRKSKNVNKRSLEASSA